MLRDHVVKGIKRYAADASLLLLFCGLLLIFSLPCVKPRRNFIDENAVNVPRPPMVIKPSDVQFPDEVAHGDSIIVRGWRSVGSETVAIYVNVAQRSSVVLANYLIGIFQRKKSMACDVNFYFVNEASSHWPIPDSFVRSSIVINISSLDKKKLCFGVYGKDGMQPNQDLFNIATSAARNWNINIDLLCQNPFMTHSTKRSRFAHYLAALQTALVAPQNPQAWHLFRSHQISTLSINSVEPGDSLSDSMVYPIAALHEQLITTLSYLDERFHHSTSVWIPLGVKEYVEYDIAQFGIILLVASILSTCYSIYEVEGLCFSPYFVLIWVFPFFASIAEDWLGTSGFFLVSAVASVLWSKCNWDLSWLTINAVSLCLLIILQPAAGLLVGSGIATQLAFLHVKCRKSLRVMFLGTFLSWAILYYFVMELHIAFFDTETIGGALLLFFVYPSAIWVSSRLIKCLIS